MNCDFCNVPKGPFVSYQTQDFEMQLIKRQPGILIWRICTCHGGWYTPDPSDVVEKSWLSTGGYCACPICHSLIRENKMEDLVERMMRMLPAGDPDMTVIHFGPPMSPREALIRGSLRGFILHRLDTNN